MSSTVEVRKGRFSVGQQVQTTQTGQTGQTGQNGISSPPLVCGSIGKSPAEQPLSPSAILASETPSPPHLPQAILPNDQPLTVASSPPVNRTQRVSTGQSGDAPAGLLESLNAQTDAKRSRFTMMPSQQPLPQQQNPSSTSSTGSTSSSMHASAIDMTQIAAALPNIPVKDDTAVPGAEFAESINSASLPPVSLVGSPPLHYSQSVMGAPQQNGTLERLRKGRFEVVSTANAAGGTPQISGRPITHGHQLSDTGSIGLFEPTMQLPADAVGYTPHVLPTAASPSISQLDLKSGEEPRMYAQSRFVVANPPPVRPNGGKLTVGTSSTGFVGVHHSQPSGWSSFALPSAASGMVSLTGLSHPAMFQSPPGYAYSEAFAPSPVAVDLVQSTIDQLCRSMDYSRTLVTDLAQRIPFITNYGNAPPLLHTPAFSDHNLAQLANSGASQQPPTDLSSDGFECGSVASESIDEKPAFPVLPTSIHQRHVSTSMPELASAVPASSLKPRGSVSYPSGGAAHNRNVSSKGSGQSVSLPPQNPAASAFRTEGSSTVSDVGHILSNLERHLQLLFRENDHLRASNDVLGRDIDALRRENLQLRRELRDFRS